MTVDTGTRFSREYGKGTLVGKEGRDFFKKPLDRQVIEMGWSHACPVIDKVVAEYGAEWTLKRYAECNFVFGLIVNSAKDLNPQLFTQLTTSTERLKNEPVGVFTEHTPESHRTEMAPMATPWGYALPRVVIEQMGRGEGNKDRSPERMAKALGIVKDAVKSSHSPIDLVVKLSEEVSKGEADPKVVLAHLLSAGVLEEENCLTMFKDLIAKMRESAPTLTKVYDSMFSEERLDLGVVGL